MLAIFTCLLFPVAIEAAILGTDPGCESEIVANKTSPNHHWNAEVLKIDCGDGYYQSTADFVVRLISVKSPEHRIDVFNVENHGSQSHVPTLKWVGKHQLQIRTTGITVGSGLLEQRYKEVSIMYSRS